MNGNSFLSRGRFYSCLYIGISCLAPLVILFFIRVYGVDLPLHDQWGRLPSVFYKASTSTLTFQDLFVQHNEHRILFPRLIMLALAYLSSSWNVTLELLVSYGFSVITFILILILIWKDSLGLKSYTLKDIHLLGISTFVSSLLLFSTVQHENWLWGFQLTWFLISMLLVGAVLSLAVFNKTGKLVYYLLGHLLCLVASFSAAHGLLIWLACLPLFLSKDLPGRNKRALLILGWLTDFMLCILIYFLGYVKPTAHPEIAFTFRQLPLSLDYYFNFLGGVFGENDTEITPLIIGVIITLIGLFFAISFLKQSIEAREDYLPWLSLSVFTIAFSVITTIGRAGFGSDQASASRYTTVTLLLLISLMQLWRLALGQKSYLRGNVTYLVTSIFLIGFLSTHFIHGYIQAFSVAEDAKYLKYQAKTCIELMDYLEPAFAKACLENTIYADFGHVIAGVDMLRAIGFLDQPPQLNLTAASSASPIHGHIDSLDVLESGSGGKLEARGWAFRNSPLPQTSVRGVVLLKSSDSKYFFAMGSIKGKRPDVAAAFNSQAYLHSGWNIPLEVEDLSTSEAIINAYLYDFHEKDIFKLAGQVQLALPKKQN